MVFFFLLHPSHDPFLLLALVAIPEHFFIFIDLCHAQNGHLLSISGDISSSYLFVIVEVQTIGMSEDLGARKF